MEFGFGTAVRGELATYDGISAMARHGEALGFASTTMADHIVFPTVSDSHYPYDSTGRHPSMGDAIEPLSLMAFLAGITDRIRLITSVLILPHRNPVLTAKMISTIDVQSRGRVTLGIGVGWLREEFAALGAPDFDARGAVSDEYVAIFRKLWSPGPVEHQGTHYSFGPIRCEPLPVQKPHPPIWVGGHSKVAIRRAARLGDGWHPLGTVDSAELRPVEFAVMVAMLREETRRSGRDPGSVGVSFVARLRETAQPVEGADRMPFNGSPAQLLDDVETYGRLGVTHLSFDFRRPTLAETLDRMAWFADSVMAPAR